MKSINTVRGLNVSTFREMNVSLKEIAGIQWGNGAGKGYLKNMVVLGLSTRLNYEVQDITTTTPECSLLLEETNANAESKNRTKDDRDKELYKKMTEIFKQNEGKSAQSFIMVELFDGKKSHIIITYPSTNIKLLNRLNIYGDKVSADYIFNSLKDKINLQGYTTNSAISEIQLYANSEGMKTEFEVPGKKSFLIKKATSFYMGEDNAYKHGKNILMGVSDKTLNVLNKTIITETLSELEDSLQKRILKDDDEYKVLDKFKEVKSKLVNSFTNLLDIKNVNPIELEKNINELKELVSDTDLSELSTLYNTYVSKRTDLKVNLSSNKEKIKEEQKLLTHKEVELKEKETEFNNNRLNYTNAYNGVKNLIGAVNDAKDKLKIPFIEIDSQLSSYKEEIKRLEIINKSNLSINEQRRANEKESSDCSKNIGRITNKNKDLNIEISKIEESIQKRNEIMFGKKDSSDDIDMLLELFNLKLKSKIINRPAFAEIIRLIKDNPADFDNTYDDLYKKMIIGREKFESEESLKNEIAELKKEINSNNSLKELDVLRIATLKKDLENLSSTESSEKQISGINIKKNSLDNISIILKKINNIEEIRSKLTSIKLSEELESKIDRSFNMEFSEETVEYQLSLFVEINEEIERDLKLVEENSVKINIEKELNKENQQKKESEFDRLDSQFNSIKEFDKLQEFLDENQALDDIDSNEDLFELELTEIEKLINKEFDKVEEKKEGFSKNYHLFKELIDELEREYPENYKDFIALYLNLINFIEAKLNNLNVSKDSLLATLQNDIEFFNTFMVESHSIARSLMKKRTSSISKLTCSTGESYQVKNNIYLEEHPQEIAIKKLFKKVFFLADEIYDLDDHQINKCLDDSSKNDLISIRDILANFGQNNDVDDFSLELYIKRKAKNFSFDSETASTGNSLVLNVGVRQQLLSKNEVFKMTIFIDEFSSIDQKNIDIMFEQDLQAPAVFLQNSYSDFEKVRPYLTLMNQNSGERGQFINNITWYHGEDDEL